MTTHALFNDTSIFHCTVSSFKVLDIFTLRPATSFMKNLSTDTLRTHLRLLEKLLQQNVSKDQVL